MAAFLFLPFNLTIWINPPQKKPPKKQQQQKNPKPKYGPLPKILFLEISFPLIKALVYKITALFYNIVGKG